MIPPNPPRSAYIPDIGPSDHLSTRWLLAFGAAKRSPGATSGTDLYEKTVALLFPSEEEQARRIAEKGGPDWVDKGKWKPVHWGTHGVYRDGDGSRRRTGVRPGGAGGGSIGTVPPRRSGVMGLLQQNQTSFASMLGPSTDLMSAPSMGMLPHAFPPFHTQMPHTALHGTHRDFWTTITSTTITPSSSTPIGTATTASASGITLPDCEGLDPSMNPEREWEDDEYNLGAEDFFTVSDDEEDGWDVFGDGDGEEDDDDGWEM